MQHIVHFRQFERVGVALQAYAGKPVNVVTGADANGDGTINDRPDSGLAPRNSLHGPAYFNLDVSVAHDPPEQGAEERPHAHHGHNVVNVLNHPNFLIFNGVIGENPSRPIPSFGTPSTAEPGRRLQLNLSSSSEPAPQKMARRHRRTIEKRTAIAAAGRKAGSKQSPSDSSTSGEEPSSSSINMNKA